MQSLPFGAPISILEILQIFACRTPSFQNSKSIQLPQPIVAAALKNIMNVYDNSVSTPVADSAAVPANTIWKGQRYYIDSQPLSFIIRGEARRTVHVELADTIIRASSSGSQIACGFFEYHQLIRWIIHEAIQDVKSPKPGESRMPRWFYPCSARAINARVYPLWRELLAQADPMIVAVQRRIFAATSKMADIAKHKALYENKYLVADLIRFPAACVAARRIDDLIQRPWILEEYGKDTLSNRIAIMGAWRRLYAPLGETYSSLEKTLTHLPGNVPPSLLTNLSRIRLSRPMTDRIELTLLSAFADCANHANLSTMMHATREEIMRAIELVGRDTHRQVPLRRAMTYRFVARYLSDFPDSHNGNIVGLKCGRPLNGTMTLVGSRHTMDLILTWFCRCRRLHHPRWKEFIFFLPWKQLCRKAV